MKKFYFAALMLIISCFLLATNSIGADKTESWKNRVFTKEELKKYNGKNGRPAYVAVEGVVYDVTNSPHWKNGQHKGMHQAGENLTEPFKTRAPKKIHIDGKVLERMPKVGILKVEDVANPPTKKEGDIHHHNETISTDTTTSASPVREKYEVSDYKVNPSYYGRTVSCPVTGEKFKITSKTPSVKYKNKEYFFCCPACVEDFKKDPQRYAK